MVNGAKPEVAPFSGRYKDLEAAFSPDGQTVYFSSDRPTTDNPQKKDFDIWRLSAA
jgi:Tol biopolymer transport system component